MTRTIRVSSDLHERVAALALDRGVTAGDALCQLLAGSDTERENIAKRGDVQKEADSVPMPHEDAGSGMPGSKDEHPESLGITAALSSLLVNLNGKLEELGEVSERLALATPVDAVEEPESTYGALSQGTGYAPPADIQAGPEHGTPRLDALVDRLRLGTPQGRQLAAWIDTHLANRS